MDKKRILDRYFGVSNYLVLCATEKKSNNYDYCPQTGPNHNSESD